MDLTGVAGAPAAIAKPSRIFIACICCKARKKRCDGGTPRCGSCVARGAECDYAPVRRTRGPGKSERHRERPAEPLSETELVLPSSGLPNSTTPDPINSIPSSTERLVGQPGPLVRVTASAGSSKTQISPAKNLIPLAADFLVPGVFELQKTMEESFKEVTANRRKFVPLLPRHFSRRLMQNVFGEAMGGYQLLDQPSFVTLLEEHYAASPVDPADSPARWALVNAVIGLMLRAKIAPGAETELSRYPRAFYRNATAVIPELILQDPSLLSIQALLAMAMFAEATSDTRSFVMLATTASRQLELLLAANQGRVPAQQVLDMAERGQLERAYEIASAFETLAAQRYGIRSLLNSDEIEGSAL